MLQFAQPRAANVFSISETEAVESLLTQIT